MHKLPSVIVQSEIFYFILYLLFLFSGTIRPSQTPYARVIYHNEKSTNESRTARYPATSDQIIFFYFLFLFVFNHTTEKYHFRPQFHDLILYDLGTI